MHGTIFSELKNYVDAKRGERAWSQVLGKAALKDKVYDPLAVYPDEEAIALIKAASEIADDALPKFLEDFGEFIASDLLRMYWGVVEPGWKTLDVIEHTEQSIHKVVRLDHPGANPPDLKAERVSPNEIVLKYKSRRKMCGLARGIAKGIAIHYGESMLIEDKSCMLKGDSACVISFKLKS